MSGGGGEQSVSGLAQLLFGPSPPPAALGRGKGRMKSFVKRTRTPPKPQASKRKASGSASSSTPATERLDLDSEDAHPSPIGTSSGIDAGCSGTQAEGQGANGGEDDDVILIDDEQVQPIGKKKKRCTSIVWKYFEKDIREVEVDGKMLSDLVSGIDCATYTNPWISSWYAHTNGFKSIQRKNRDKKGSYRLYDSKGTTE